MSKRVLLMNKGIMLMSKRVMFMNKARMLMSKRAMLMNKAPMLMSKMVLLIYKGLMLISKKVLLMNKAVMLMSKGPKFMDKILLLTITAGVRGHGERPCPGIPKGRSTDAPCRVQVSWGAGRGPPLPLHLARGPPCAPPPPNGTVLAGTIGVRTSTTALGLRGKKPSNKTNCHGRDQTWDRSSHVNPTGRKGRFHCGTDDR